MTPQCMLNFEREYAGRVRERKTEREREQNGQTPWSGLKCCQWQSDVPLNRITPKVSCHHIPAAHYQGHGSLWDDREWLDFPSFLWTLLEHAAEKMFKRKNRWSVIGPVAAMLMNVWAERSMWTVAIWRYCLTNQKWITADFTIHRVCKNTSYQRYCCYWQSPPQTGQRDENNIYSCEQANVLKVELYNIFK